MRGVEWPLLENSLVTRLSSCLWTPASADNHVRTVFGLVLVLVESMKLE